jgi:hypothetical protein
MSAIVVIDGAPSDLKPPNPASLRQRLQQRGAAHANHCRNASIAEYMSGIDGCQRDTGIGATAPATLLGAALVETGLVAVAALRS